MLHTRKERVVIVSRDDNYPISLSKSQIADGEEIEKQIVADLVKKHDAFMASAEKVR